MHTVNDTTNEDLVSVPEAVARHGKFRAVRSVLTTLLFCAFAFFAWPTSLGGSTSVVIVTGESMLPTIEPSEIAVARAQDHYALGDVVVYPIPAGQAGAGHLIIHRIVGGDKDTGWVTRGDNRAYEDPWNPTDAQVRGKIAVHFPGGYTLRKILLIVSSPLGIGLFGGLAAYAAAFKFSRRNRPESSADSAPLNTVSDRDERSGKEES